MENVHTYAVQFATTALLRWAMEPAGLELRVIARIRLMCSCWFRVERYSDILPVGREPCWPFPVEVLHFL